MNPSSVAVIFPQILRAQQNHLKKLILFVIFCLFSFCFVVVVFSFFRLILQAVQNFQQRAYFVQWWACLSNSLLTNFNWTRRPFEFLMWLKNETKTTPQRKALFTLIKISNALVRFFHQATHLVLTPSPFRPLMQWVSDTHRFHCCHWPI